MGLSLGLTRQYYGPSAEQRALVDLGGRRPPRRFALSNGAFCDVEARTCWRDGRSRNQVADRLTQDLFGALPPAPQPKPIPIPGPGPTPGPAPTPPANLSFPSAGVICDQAVKICYNNQGISQMLSAANFGQPGMFAATMAIRNGLQRQFLLSNGTFCDVSVPGCWADGVSKRLPAVAIVNQLFGLNPAGGGGTNAAVSSCRLQRGFQILYSGSCQLSRQQDGYRNRFVAQLGNGASYSFVNRNGTYVISDASGGVWPVNYRDQGATGVFSWNDLSLTVTQTGPNVGSALGRSLGSLLESLFR